MNEGLSILFRQSQWVRRQFETRKTDKALLKILYLSWQHVPDIDSFLCEAENLFPSLNCGLASVFLKYYLGEGEITHGYYKETPHSFLWICSKDVIIDITADQFSGSPVYVGAYHYPWIMGAPTHRLIKETHDAI